jgi:CBS domain containing-hemolysin-like protein
MVPLASAATVAAEKPVAEAIAVCRLRNFTRLPAVDARTHHIIGIVNLEHLIFSKDVDPTKPARDYLQPAFYLPEDLHVEEALRRMQHTGWRLAVVLGRDTREAGIITLQDVLKLIFGELNL